MQNHYAPPRANVADVNRSSSGISEVMLDAMRGTKPWVMLIGVVLIVSAVFMFLGTLGMVAGGAMTMGMTGGGEAAMLVGVGLVYGIMGVIYMIMGVYLVKYHAAIAKLLQNSRSEDMEEALHSQRKFWKLSGILTLVMIVIVVLGMIAAIFIPAMMLGAGF